MTPHTTDQAAPPGRQLASAAPVLLREVNERIRDLEHGRASGLYDLVCECGDDTCTAVMRMTAEEYEAVRSEPGTYAVLPNHECVTDIVVRRWEGYVVIRLADEEAPVG
jgi:hypothetical protein